MKKREPGIFRGESFEEYQVIEAVNNSSLKHMTRSAAHFYAEVLDPEREAKAPSDALILGNAIHTAILEPDLFVHKYAVVPDDAPKRPTSVQRSAKKPSDDTVAAIEFWDRFNAENAGRIILTKDQAEICRKVSRKFLSSNTAQFLFSKGQPEVSLVWEDPIEEVLCKGRADWINDTMIIDIKSSIDASEAEFSRAAFNYDYAMQAAFYLDGYKALTGKELIFVIAVFEKAPPFECRFYVVSDKMIDFGRKKYRALLAKYAKAAKTGIWEGYTDELTTLELPSWVEKTLERNPQEF